MNEEDAVEKMRDLMSTMDAMEKFKNIREKFPAVVLIAIGSILASALIFLMVYLYDYITVTFFLGYIYIHNIGFGAGVFAAIAWVAGILLIYWTLSKAYKVISHTNWEDDLEEGPIGIIKIMSRYDWNRKLLDLKQAKQGFVLVTILQLLLNFFFIFVFTFIGFGLIISLFFQMSPDPYVVLVLSIVITLVLGDRNLRRLYRRLWSADILIGEVGGFYSEFSERQL